MQVFAYPSFASVKNSQKRKLIIMQFTKRFLSVENFWQNYYTNFKFYDIIILTIYALRRIEILSVKGERKNEK